MPTDSPSVISSPMKPFANAISRMKPKYTTSIAPVRTSATRRRLAATASSAASSASTEEDREPGVAICTPPVGDAIGRTRRF
jgi:hypothetical protein